MLPTWDEIEKFIILRRLVTYHFNNVRAARSLRIGVSTMYRKLRSWGLKPPYGNNFYPNRVVAVRWRAAILADLKQLAGEMSHEAGLFSSLIGDNESSRTSLLEEQLQLSK